MNKTNDICGHCIHFIKDDIKNMRGHCPFHRDVEFPEHESCGEFSDTLPSKPPSDIITNRRMDPMEHKDESVPFMAFESALARMDRHNRWLIIVIIILVILFVGSNMYWIYQWNTYEIVDDYSVEVDSKGEGIANYLNGDGDINNGTSTSNEAQGQTKEALNAEDSL